MIKQEITAIPVANLVNRILERQRLVDDLKENIWELTPILNGKGMPILDAEGNPLFNRGKGQHKVLNTILDSVAAELGEGLKEDERRGLLEKLLGHECKKAMDFVIFGQIK